MRRAVTPVLGTLLRPLVPQAAASPGVASPGVQRRAKGFSMFMYSDDPAKTLRHAREVRAELEDRHGTKWTAARLHNLIAIAVAHFQLGDHATARECAVYAHKTILEERHGRHSLLYFSATTCAKACEALAQRYETHLASEGPEVRNRVAPRDRTLREAAPERVAYRLREEAARYQATADRIFWAPENGFMRSGADARRAGWDDRSGDHSGDSSRRGAHHHTARRQQSQERPEAPRPR